MQAAKKLTVPSNEEIRCEALRALVKQMGVAKAAMFIRENMARETDYLKTKDELFGSKSVTELAGEIRHIKGKRKK